MISFAQVVVEAMIQQHELWMPRSIDLNSLDSERTSLALEENPGSQLHDSTTPQNQTTSVDHPLVTCCACPKP